MKAVMKFDMAGGERTVAFDTDAHTFSSSEGHSGAYVHEGNTLVMKVQGVEVVVALEKNLTAIGEKTNFTSAQGNGVATLVSAG